MEIFPEVNVWVKKGQKVAKISNVFGKIIKIITAPCTSIVIGKNVKFKKKKFKLNFKKIFLIIGKSCCLFW
jgi:preprotein translocase subunit YajC